MKKLFLYLLGGLVLIGGNMFLGSITLAQTQTTDCSETSSFGGDEFVQAVIKNLSEAKQPYTLKIFTDKDLKVALKFHQQYCCQTDINEETCKGKLDGTHYFPESPYLFDHLVNIGMRKFNGIQEHCDTLGIDCQTRDNAVLLKEWREESQKLAEETDGVPPSQLYELFKKYWGDVESFAQSDKNTQIANAYFTLCNEAMLIRNAVKLNLADGINQQDLWIQGCQKLIEERYLQEAKYVQALMVDKGVSYLQENLRAYAKTYFIDNRMSAFVDKFGKLDACYNMVLKYVTRTSCCVN